MEASGGSMIFSREVYEFCCGIFYSVVFGNSIVEII